MSARTSNCFIETDNLIPLIQRADWILLNCIEGVEYLDGSIYGPILMIISSLCYAIRFMRVRPS